MLKHPAISLLFPAYNEEANIALSVEQAERVLQGLTGAFEIVVVDDGSRDGTARVLDELAASRPYLKVVRHATNLGYGAALWSGIQAARYDWVFFTDADLQFDLGEISALLGYIPEFKAVIGYRSPRRDPLVRRMNGWGWNMLVRLLFGLKVRDVDCAFKLFDRKMLAGLPLVTRGAAMSAEMLIRLQHMGIAWKEVPVRHLPRQRGRSTGANPAVITRAFRELFRLYIEQPWDDAAMR